MFPMILAAAIATVMPVKAGQSNSSCAHVDNSVPGKTIASDPITAFCVSHYRNDSGVENAPITLFAGIDNSNTGCRKEQIDVYFTFENPEGKAVRKKAKYFDGTNASIAVWPTELKVGKQDFTIDVSACNGKKIASRTLGFTRLAKRIRRAVAIDRHKRVVLGVSGKPFFPIGIYADTTTSNIVERVGKSPFNTLVAYRGINREMLNWCSEHDLMACVSAGDYQTSEDLVGRNVSKLKGHPALLAWLLTDDKFLPSVQQMKTRYRTMLDRDDGHPTWAVFRQVDQIRDYLGTCDAIGFLPYPVSDSQLPQVHFSIQKGRQGTFGALPLWQTAQMFDLGEDKANATTGADAPKYRAPMLAEMKATAWLQIADGANAVFMHSYAPLDKMNQSGFGEKHWREICECAAEIAEVSDIMLSIGNAPRFENIPDSLSVRTWRTGAKIHVLVCNASGKALKAKLPLGNDRFENMRTVFGGGVKMETGNILSVEFEPEGYAFISFDGDKPIDFEELKYNRSGASAYLDGGIWAKPLVLDYDSDGDLDVLIMSRSALTNAFILYENPTPKGVKCKMPIFKKGRTISTDTCGAHISSQLFDGKWIVTNPGGVMWDPINRWGKFTKITGAERDPLFRDSKISVRTSDVPVIGHRRHRREWCIFLR